MSLRVAAAAALALALFWAEPAAAGDPVQSVAAVSRCLRAHGAALAQVPRSNASLRTLHDLAQRRSFVARIGRSSVGIAVLPSAANAQLLAELLVIPRSGYTTSRRQNVILLSRRTDRAAARVATRCTRG